MIAGKTRSEILSMARSTRSRWYKIILPEEREEAMKIVEIGRRFKQRASWTPERRAECGSRMTGKNHPMYGKKRPEVSEQMSGENNPMKRPEVIAKRSGMNHPMYGRTHTEKVKTKQRERMTGKNNPMKRPEVIVKRSGENHYNWKGGLTPYCPAFNNRTREHIRNLYNRTCTVCGKSTLQNINKNGEWLGRLAVDHIDDNKMQGCGDWEWRLTPLCHFCHNRMQKQKLPWHLLLHLLLLNNKKQQTNFLFEYEML